jgi:hypothetical protein
MQAWLYIEPTPLPLGAIELTDRDPVDSDGNSVDTHKWIMPIVPDLGVLKHDSFSKFTTTHLTSQPGASDGLVRKGFCYQKFAYEY